MQTNSFTDCFDTIMTINKMARENLGEDSFFCAEDGKSAIVSVFDGCGGLGARPYESFGGHTGAYIASRAVCGAVHDWYYGSGRNTLDSGKMAEDMKGYIGKAYGVCERYAVERMKIMGSMVRKFPTTLALSYAEREKNGVRVHILWTGDSRVYLLDSNGLAQLTVDDTDVPDALENLTCDGSMNNVVSSDGNFSINHRTLVLSEAAMILAATDGCFGYVSSPMEFEYILVKHLVESKNPEEFRKNLEACLDEYAGDDFTMGIMSFGYGDFFATSQAFRQRKKFLEKEYMSFLEQEEDQIKELWRKYKRGYERYLEI